MKTLKLYIFITNCVSTPQIGIFSDSDESCFKKARGYFRIKNSLTCNLQLKKTVSIGEDRLWLDTNQH